MIVLAKHSTQLSAANLMAFHLLARAAAPPALPLFAVPFYTPFLFPVSALDCRIEELRLEKEGKTQRKEGGQWRRNHEKDWTDFTGGK